MGKFIEILTLIILVVILAVLSYIAWDLYPKLINKDVEFFSNDSGSYGVFSGGEVFGISDGSQFYPNMRYKNKEIKYWVEPICSDEKKLEIRGALTTLSERTVLTFKNVNKVSAELSIFCSEIAPESGDDSHFIAGEGGPSRILNTSLYTVILSGKVSLFRDDKCEKPQVAIHEILHALGFDHKKDPNSVLYPVTNCNQEIDQSIIDDLNRLYNVESLPDLAIKSAKANLSGRYMNFNVAVENQGLQDSSDATLEVYDSDGFVKSFSLGSLEVGAIKTISVQNLRVSPDVSKIYFLVMSGKEITMENNKVDMVVAA